MQNQTAIANAPAAVPVGQYGFLPFSALVRTNKNVRTTKPPKKYKAHVARLADSMLTQGVLQNLIVFPLRPDSEEAQGKEGLHGVAGGEGRMDALALLLSQGKISPDYPVPVRFDTEENATAVSTTENSHREEMHKADMFAAFAKANTKEGMSIDDIAAKFGVSSHTVRRGLKLANVSPCFVKMYREDKVTIEQMMALAISDDHKAQRRVWDAAQGEWMRKPDALRRALTVNEVCSTDSLARFVGVAEYKAAGGAVRSDLFAENDVCYLLDIELLDALADKKLQDMAAPIKEEGWAWVVVDHKMQRNAVSEFGTMSKAEREPNKKEAKAIEAAKAKIAKADIARQAAEEAEDEEAEDAAIAAGDAAEQALNELMSQLQEWTPEIMEVSGVIVTIANGDLHATYGCIRPEDKRAAAKVKAGVEQDNAGEERAKPDFSERLTMNLTAHRTAAIQAVIATRPDMALIVLTHSLAHSVFYNRHYGSIVRIRTDVTDNTAWAQELPATKAGTALDELRAEWVAKLPENPDHLFEWMLGQSPEDINALMAICTANVINTINSNQNDEAHAAKQVMGALNVNMADWWKPTKDSFFAHIRKGVMAKTVEAAVSAEAAAELITMKKDDAGEHAQALMSESGWLPALLAA